MNPEVDDFLKEGCGRCSLFQTPQCKVHSWTEELKELRRIALDSELTEDRKWGVPCYTYNEKNVSLLAAFKDYASFSFFKGALLPDPKGLLKQAGENTQVARVLQFTDAKDILENEAAIRHLIKEAIKAEKEGRKGEYKKNPEPMPEELETALEENPDLKEAYEALTPGRQRSYILHVSQAKNPSTRISRIQKCIPKIMEGKGFHDK